MKKLLKNKKGFTLMEMLIVVAIIVILVAVSMPVFSKQLTKAKEATDQANERAAKAIAVAEYLTNETTGDFVYDAINGAIYKKNSAEANAIKTYGKMEGHQWIELTITDNGTVTYNWK